MKKEIAALVEISRFYGRQKDYTLGGGGNTSFKNKRHLYVKASGHSLSDITEDGFAVLDREKLSSIMHRQYSTEAQQREKEVMTDLMNSLEEGQKKQRPSVEASLHDIIHYDFVVHTHPYLINALLCANEAEIHVKELFDDQALYVPYTDPGYILSKTVLQYLEGYRSEKQREPNIIFLQNHGVFVGANSTQEIKIIYESIREKIFTKIQNLIQIDPIEYQGPVDQLLSNIAAVMGNELHFKIEFNTLIAHFTKDIHSILRIGKPFIPDQIVYCKAQPLIIPLSRNLSVSPATAKKTFEIYHKRHHYDPKIVIIEKGPVIAIEKNDQTAALVLDVFLDAMKISFYSNYFGGPHFMLDEQIRFIENWEVENYRRKVSTGN